MGRQVARPPKHDVTALNRLAIFQRKLHRYKASGMLCAGCLCMLCACTGDTKFASQRQKQELFGCDPVVSLQRARISLEVACSLLTCCNGPPATPSPTKNVTCFPVTFTYFFWYLISTKECGVLFGVYKGVLSTVWDLGIHDWGCNFHGPATTAWNLLATLGPDTEICLLR